MPDQSPAMQSPEVPSVPGTFVPGPWDPTVAGKKIAWALGKFGVSVTTAPSLAPTATAIIEKISSITTPYGISIHINQPVFEKALPILMFAVLVTIHDYLKVKTKAKWL